MHSNTYWRKLLSLHRSSFYTVGFGHAVRCGYPLFLGHSHAHGSFVVFSFHANATLNNVFFLWVLLQTKGAQIALERAQFMRGRWIFESLLRIPESETANFTNFSLTWKLVSDADPGTGAFFWPLDPNPGSGMEKSGSRILDKNRILYLWELSNTVIG